MDGSSAWIDEQAYLLVVRLNTLPSGSGRASGRWGWASDSGQSCGAGVISLFGLDPTSYAPHRLHGDERTFPETNCYTDLWIEVLHSRELEPVAMLAFCTTVDFEGDQWTFFKPPHADLEALYGMEIQELQIYRPLSEHVVDQIRLGRLVTIEVDGHFLPDTADRSYRLTHEKTSIAVEAIDVDREILRYFHNGGYFELSGEDYRHALRLEPLPPDNLLPYAEFVRMDRLAAVPAEDLRATAAVLLERHLTLRPRSNPVRRFGERLSADLPELMSEEAYHLYAFATLRQCGAAWEAAATFLRWLDDQAHDSAAGAFESLTVSSKRLLFKLARTAMTGRPLDPLAAISEMAASWDTAFDALSK